MMSKLDALLFDLDGTLVDSNQLIIEAYRKTFAVYDPEKYYTDADIIDLIGPPLEETFGKLTSDGKLIGDMIDTYRNAYVALEFQYAKPYPDMLETVAKLKSMGYRIGVVTTKFRESAFPSLNKFGIDAFLDVLVGLDDVKHHKPHPEPVIRAMKELDATTALMIGDNASDILAGRYAGIKTCGVKWSIKLAELENAKPDYWISGFRELLSLTEKIAKER